MHSNSNNDSMIVGCSLIEFDADAFSHPEFAWAGLELYIECGDLCEGFTANGIAKRHPTDKPDEETAYLLAVGRALETLSRRVLKRANGRVKHADDMKIVKEKQKLDDLADEYRTHCWICNEDSCNFPSISF